MAFGVSRSEAAANLRRYEDRVRRMNEKVERDREESRARAQRHQDIQRGSIARRQAEQEAELAGRGPNVRDANERQAIAEAKMAEYDEQEAQARNTVWKFTARDSQRRTRLMSARQDLVNNSAFSLEQVEAGVQQIDAQIESIQKQAFSRGRDEPYWPDGPPGTWVTKGGAEYVIDANGIPKVVHRWDQGKERREMELDAKRKEISSKNAFDRRKFQHDLETETITTGMKGVDQREEPKYTKEQIKEMSWRLYPPTGPEEEEMFSPTLDAGDIVEPELSLEPPEVQAARELLAKGSGFFEGMFDAGRIASEQRKAQKVIEKWEKGVADVDKKLPVVNNEADLAKLKPGQRFRSADGRTGTKN